MVTGGLVAGGFVPGGFVAGGFVPGGFVAGGFVAGGFVAGGVSAQLVVSPWQVALFPSGPKGPHAVGLQKTTILRQLVVLTPS